ncbi:MAG TPA: sigma 54-interacting transcriptional regulator [Pyrinomonadaceae bacterium]|nr:sigma 54-interacting transcriptional regulator [Pyrinomonadaceae bacterium]
MGITNHNEASQRLTRSDDRLWLLLDTTPALLHTGLPDGSLDFFNRRWLDYVGLPLTDLLGWRWTNAIHPKDVGELVAKWRAALESGEPFEAESRVRRADGQYRWFLHRKVALRDELGKIVKWYGSSIEIEDRKRFLEELQTKNQLLDLAQKAARVMAFEWYLQQEVNIWSPEHEALYGLLPGAFDGRYQSWKKMVHPQDWPSILESIKHAHDTGEVSSEFRVVWPDGSIHWLAANGQMFFDNEGRPSRIVGFTGDVTPRKLVEERLRRSQAHLAEGQRLSQTGSFGWHLSRAELYWSEETFRIFEYDRAIKPTVEHVLERTHPEDRILVQQSIKRAQEERKDFELEHRLLLPDGSVKYLHVVAQAFLENDEFVGAVTDITAPRRAEQKIRQDQLELRQLIDFLPHMVFVLNPGGDFIHANQKVFDYTGFSPQQMREVGAERLIEWGSHPDDAEKVRNECHRGISNGTPFEIERRIIAKDGSYRWFLIRYNPLLDETGRIVRWFGSTTDIDDRKQAEEGIRKENIALREEIVKTSMFEEIIGTSPALQAVLTLVAKVAPTESTVLITGETGSGKELIARAIHRRSTRSARAFVSVNCAAIPPSLIASELFGHEKGAFTGAVQRRLGRFELAEGGTIFLDEIGELTAETQVALLRVLQEHEFGRVGGNRSIRTDVRVIVATNRNLEAAMTAGTFRSDLFYRLNVFPIEMPALRDRREDIPLLVEYFIDRFSRKAGKKIRRINKKTLELLQSYPWPGNIRELQNVIERSVILCEGEDFSVDESWLSRQPVVTELGGDMELSQRLAAHEKEAIEAALSESGGRVFGPSGAAVKLGMPRSTLESKIRSLKIDKNRFKIADPSKDN